MIQPSAQRRIKGLLKAVGSPIGSIVAVRPSINIVLTFDDGPDSVGTEQVLAALAAHRATATFFVLMTRARLAPQLLERIIAEGHELGLHGADHRALTQFSIPDARRRTLRAKVELEELSGQTIRWFRPPYGRQTLRTWAIVRSIGLVPVMWNATNWDSRSDVDEHMRLGRAGLARPGDILLGHDNFAEALDGADDGAHPELDRYELTDQVLRMYEKRGLGGQSLGSSLAAGRPVKSFWFGR